MSFKVRLRGLPPLADSIHIRRFFTGLKIPSGGVTIIGGVDGEAFVKFETFQGAFLALNRSGRPLMDSCIQVSLDRTTKLNFRKQCQVCRPGYVRISLHPFDASFSDVKRFFKNFSVKSVIFLTKNKVRNGQALVKFAKYKHACKALSITLSNHNGTSKQPKPKKHFCVLSVKKSDQAEWIKFGGRVDPKEKEPEYEELNTLYIHEFYAHLLNVSRRAEKRHIKKFLYDLVDDSQITFVYDKDGCRTRDCFVMFVTDSDYTRALGLDKSVFQGRPVRVLPVSKEKLKEFIEAKKMGIANDSDSETDLISDADLVSDEDSSSLSCSGCGLTCVYLRNFAADVNKMDILNFFTGFALNEEDIHLLYDNGHGLGEALVKFSSEEEASRAEKLNRKCFQGTEILLRCISEEQLKLFGVGNCQREYQSEDLQACVSVADDISDVSSDSF